MNRFFKNMNIFLAEKKSIFTSKKLGKKLNKFDRNFWIFSKIFKFYETYKCRDNFDEFFYLVVKFTVAAQGIFSVGKLGPLIKTIKRPPQEVRGRRPSGGSEVSFFKTIQDIWKWIRFSKMSTFYFPKDPFFPKKNLRKWNIFYKNFSIFFEKIF